LSFSETTIARPFIGTSFERFDRKFNFLVENNLAIAFWIRVLAEVPTEEKKKQRSIALPERNPGILASFICTHVIK
jgi:hypothetical protein